MSTNVIAVIKVVGGSINKRKGAAMVFGGSNISCHCIVGRGR